MTTTIMLVALGFLSAILLALFVVPLVWRRAVKVTSRRMRGAPSPKRTERSLVAQESEGPLADHSRNTHKLEQRLQGLKEKLAGQAVETARHNSTIEDLQKVVAAKDAELSERDAEIARRKTAVAPLETELVARTEAVQRMRAQVRETEETGKALESRMMETRKEIELRDKKIAKLSETVELNKSEIARIETEKAKIGETLSQRGVEIEGLQATLRENENLRTALQEKMDVADASIAAKDREIERLLSTGKAQSETLKTQELTIQKAKDVTALSHDESVRLRDAIVAHDQKLAEQAKTIAESEAAARTLKEQIAALTEDVNLRNAKLTAQAQTIERLTEAAAQKETEINELRIDLDANQAKVQESDRASISINAAVQSKDAEVAGLRDAAKKQDERISALASDLAVARRELSGRMQDVTRLTADTQENQKLVAERDASIVALREELAQLGAKSTEDLQALREKITNLETERSVLVADLDLAGEETNKLLQEFDKLDDLWLTEAEDTPKPDGLVPSKAAEQPSDKSSPLPDPSGSILRILPGGKVLTGGVDKAPGSKPVAPVSGKQNGTAPAPSAAAPKGVASASMADRFRALQDKFG